MHSHLYVDCFPSYHDVFRDTLIKCQGNIYDNITLCIYDFENCVCVRISFSTFRFCNMLVTALRMVCQSIRPGISLYLLHSNTASKETGKSSPWGGGECYSLSRTELCSRPGELMVSFVFIIFFSCISQSPLFIFFDFSSDLTFLVFFHLVLFYLMMMNMGSQTMGLQSCVSVCLSLCHTQSVLRLYTPPLSPVYPPRPRITAL